MEAYNNASPELKVLLKDLKEVAEQAKRTHTAVSVAMGDIRTSKSGKSYQTPAGGWRKMSTLDPAGSGQDQIREFQRVIKVKSSEERKAAAERARQFAKENADRINFHKVMDQTEDKNARESKRRRDEQARATAKQNTERVNFHKVMDGVEDKNAAARKKAADEQARKDAQHNAQRINFHKVMDGVDDKNARAASQRRKQAVDDGNKAARETVRQRNQTAKAHADAVKETDRLFKQLERDRQRQTRDFEREQRNAERRTQMASRTRAQGVGRIFSGGSSMLEGASRISGTVLDFGRNLHQATNWAVGFGKAVVGHVVGALRDVEKYAIIAAGAVALIGGVTAKAGVDFNQFKENTLLTITALTNSGKEAQKIFEGSFDLAILSKFQVQEVLEGARTLEAFGIKYQRYGQETGRYLTGAVALAQGMEKPLAQVTRFLGNLSQGRLLLQQAAPLGMGRQTLQQYGVKFDSHGSPTDRTKLLEAAMKAIEDRWGKLLNLMENTYETKMDAMISSSKIFGGKITEGLFGSLTRAFGNAAEMFKKLINPEDDATKRLVEGLKTPFDLLGAAIENASKYLPKFVEWLGSIMTKKNVINFLAEIVSVVRVMFEDIKGLVEQASGGKGLVGLWESFRDAALGAVDAAMEAWTEFRANVEFFIGKAPDLWELIEEGARSFAAALEVIVGLLATKFAADTLGGLLQTALGFKNAISGIGQAAGGKAAVKGGMGPVGLSTVALTPGAGGSGSGSATRQREIEELYDKYSVLPGPHKVSKWWNDGMEYNKKSWESHRLNPFGSRFLKGRTPEQQAELDAIDPNNQPKIQKAIDSYRKAHPEYRAPGEPAMDPKKVQAAVDNFRKANPNYRAPGEPWSKNLDGGGGVLQAAGRKVIGGAIDFGISSIPDSWKNLNTEREAYVKSQMGTLRDNQARRNKRLGYKQEAVDALEGMTGGKMTPPPDMNAIRAAQRVQLEADPELMDAIIEAHEKSMRGNDTNTKAQLRARLIPLYMKKAETQNDAINDAWEEIQVNVNSMGNEKSYDERKADVIKYWGAVKDQWDTQSEIQEIQRQAVNAVSDQMKEANEAQTEFMQAQIEMLPDSQQAFAAAEAMVPMLAERQRIVLDKLRYVQQGSKEYWAGMSEAMRIEKQIVDTKNDAADEAAKQAFEGPKRQFSTINKMINMLPKGMRKKANMALLGPRVEAAFQAAQMERDPVKRQERMLEVADMFTEMQEARKQSDPFKGLFDKASAGQRGMAVRDYQNRMSGKAGAKRYRIKDQQNVFSAMSPFSAGGVGNGTAFSNDRFYQMVFNLPVNANEEQMANFVMSTLRNEMQKTWGR